LAIPSGATGSHQAFNLKSVVSVVTKDIPSGVLAAGNPAKVIKSLE